ncbi:SRR1 domain-containing protein [Mycena chlorophos]|uniref:SRR1 domain-containing protein n=1 Tax=Mycena chlorophos TaxID=658473 RepID=A0A8H6WI30_MYCCL|nr:SRR1 domain-containing protein [Mycena chlorophos]
MSESVVVHPMNPRYRIRPHPGSVLHRRECHAHPGGDCSHLALHHVDGTWSDEERAAHPEWTWNLVYLCRDAAHSCVPACSFVSILSSPVRLCLIFHLSRPVARESSVADKIAYLHASADWDEHWLREPCFQLSADSELLLALNSRQVSLIQSSLSKIGRAYDDMKSSGYLDKLASFFGDVFSSSSAPPRPTSTFGAGFSGYDRLDPDGYDRAGYTMAEGHSSTDWEARTHYQIAYFVELGRIFQIPASLNVAYDPCYSIVDVVVLAALGIRGLTRTDAARPFLRIFTTPTLFYAPGAEQHTVGDAILRTPDSTQLLLQVGDVTWCLEPHEAVDGSGESYEGYPHDLIAAYVLSYKKVAIPAHRIEMKPGEAREAPAGENHLLQWIPVSQREAFEKRRGPAREPDIRMMYLPGGGQMIDD